VGGFNTTQRPNCTAPGDRVFVVKIDSTTRRRVVLDHGRTLDPSSLRVSHGRISWKHGAERRHARLK
jgi:hypothetical protein